MARLQPRLKAHEARALQRSAAPLPDFIPPQLATPAPVPPEGKEWVHEIK